jgi:hypothetical protein
MNLSVKHKWATKIFILTQQYVRLNFLNQGAQLLSNTPTKGY